MPRIIRPRLDAGVHRGQIEREEQAVGAARSAVGAGVEALVAIGRQRLDRADRRHDLVADELQRGDDIVPLVGGRDLERLGAALAPGRGGADQLPERDDASRRPRRRGGRGRRRARRGSPASGRARRGNPGRSGPARGRSHGRARGRGGRIPGPAQAAGAKAGATTAGAATSACGAAVPWSAETAVEAGAKASDAAIAADPINFSISKR